MYVICAPDSFKGSMTAPEAARRLAAAVRAVLPDAEIVELPISDGGEGFTTAVAAAGLSEVSQHSVHDQLGREHLAELAIETRDGERVAVCDVAATSGLELVPPEDRQVLDYHSGGLGELIRAALDAGIDRLVIGIGGSSTNDGGAGMLAALGVRFLDAAGEPIEPSPAGLRTLAEVDASGLDPRLAGVRVEVASDVTNPLLGPNGASAIYGPQKGATTPELVAELDSTLQRLLSRSGPDAARVAELPGSGAAGGLGWALQHFLGATLRPGLELVAELVGLDDHLARADLVLTAEGSVDRQTPNGKAIARICEHAAAVGVPVLVFGGRVDLEPELLPGEVVDIVTITPADQPLAEALVAGPENLQAAATRALAGWVARA